MCPAPFRYQCHPIPRIVMSPAASPVVPATTFRNFAGFRHSRHFRHLRSDTPSLSCLRRLRLCQL
jgi:hypothetical protein